MAEEGPISSAVVDWERSQLQLELRSFADALPSIVWTSDPQGDVQWVSQRAVEYFGCPAEALHGKGISDFVHPDDLHQLISRWDEGLRDGTPFEVEHRIRRFDGEYLWHLARAEPRRDSSERVFGWIGACTNVDGQRRYEELLKLRVRQQAAVAELGQYALTSPPLEQIFERAVVVLSETIGVPLAVLLKAEGDQFRVISRAGIGSKLSSSTLPRNRDFLTGFTFEHEVPVFVEDITREKRFRFSPLIQEQGARSGLTCLVRGREGKWGVLAVFDTRPRGFIREDGDFVQAVANIVAQAVVRDESAQALLDSEERLRLAVVGAQVGVWVWDVPHNLLECSDLVRKHIGFAESAPATVEGFFACVDSRDRDRIEFELMRSMRERRGFSVEFRTAASDPDREHWVAAMGRCFQDDHGQPHRFVGITLDITERKEAEEYIFKLNQMLESRVVERTEELLAANREMESFCYSVSHDLRAPLRAIMATSMMLLEEMDDAISEEHRHMLERQATAAKRMGSLIDDLLKLSRLGRSELVKTQFDLTALAEEVVAEFSTVADLATQPKIDIEEGLVAFGDQKLVKLALQNLIENAIKFAKTDAACDVHIGMQSSEHGDAFYVKDNGIGFDMQYVAKIFLPFERLVRDGDYPGTGIGLANVKRIVERHGGKVWAESRLGEGSTFFFVL